MGDIERKKLLISAAGLLQEPGDDMRRVDLLVGSRLAKLQDTAVDFRRGKESNRLRGTQLSEPHGGYVYVSRLISHKETSTRKTYLEPYDPWSDLVLESMLLLRFAAV